MEIKINKEIRTYKETIFFGLSLRQFICAVLSVGTAVGLYFCLHGVLGRARQGDPLLRLFPEGQSGDTDDYAG